MVLTFCAVIFYGVVPNGIAQPAAQQSTKDAIKPTVKSAVKPSSKSALKPSLKPAAKFVVGAGEDSEVEIGGLVLDRSITRFGKEFSYEFSVLWREVPDTSGYNITIVESVIPQSGTVLWVDINQEKVYQTFFGRRNNSTVKRTAEIAVQQVIKHIAQKSIQKNNPDMVGNGY